MKIVIFSDYYLPGFKAGGPIKSIKNIAKFLRDKSDVIIITRNHDLGEKKSYHVQSDTLLKIDEVGIIYVSSIFGLLKQLYLVFTQKDVDIFYINSFFSLKFSMLPLVFARVFNAGCSKVYLAPRGELSKSALESGNSKIKILAKKIWISLFRTFFLSTVTRWQASSESEQNDIENNFDSTSTSLVPDISDIPESVSEFRQKNVDEIKIIFVSRIVPVKNLLFCFEVLKGCKFHAVFDVYGPIEELDYWKSCLENSNDLPKNIHFEYKGVLQSDLVAKTIAQYDILFSPSLTENYGHVIVESMLAGTPVLISRNTPWRNLDSVSAGWDLELDVNDFQAILTDVAKQSDDQWNIKRENARHYILNHPNLSNAIHENHRFFLGTSKEVNE